MMFRLIVSAMIAMLLSSCTAYARTVELPTERVLYLGSVVSRGTVNPLRAALDAYAAESKDPITLIINSPGGEVTSGFGFINSMRNAIAAGVRIDCYVTDMAASMAFQIFTECSRRYSLDNSFLLFHRVRVMVMMAVVTAPRAEALATDLRHFDETVLSAVEAKLWQMDHDDLIAAFEAERLWFGTQLATAAPSFVTTVDGYSNLSAVLKKLSTQFRTLPQEPDFDQLRLRTHEYIYQWDAGITGAATTGVE